MPEHLEFSAHMTANEDHAPVSQTYLGQAHIAGTGPVGTTCRECVFWHCWKADSKREGVYHHAPAGYYKDGSLKKAICNKPIINKAYRLVPHYAPSCRLFQASEIPQPAKK